MSDNAKVLGFKIDIEGITGEAAELAQLELSLKNLKKAKDDLMKSYQAGKTTEEQAVQSLKYLSSEIAIQTTRQQELKKIIDSAPDSLNRMRAELIRLKGEYANASQEVAKGMIPNINKLTTEISKQENAIGVHQRNVGNYGTKILEFGKQILGFIGITAGIEGVIHAAKGIIDSTQGSMYKIEETMKGVSTATEKFLQMIATGDMSNFVANLDKAFQAGKEYAEALRQIEERRLGLSLEESDLLKKQATYMQEARNNENDATTRQENLNNYRDVSNKLAKHGLDIANEAVETKEKELADIGIQASKLKELYEHYNSDIDTIKDAEKKLALIRKINLDEAQYTRSHYNSLNQDVLNNYEKQVKDVYGSMTDEEKHYSDLLATNDKVKKGDLTEYIELLKKQNTESAKPAEILKETQRAQNSINKAQDAGAKSQEEADKKREVAIEKRRKQEKEANDEAEKFIQETLKEWKKAEEEKWKEGLETGKLLYDQTEKAAKDIWDAKMRTNKILKDMDEDAEKDAVSRGLITQKQFLKNKRDADVAEAKATIKDKDELEARLAQIEKKYEKDEKARKEKLRKDIDNAVLAGAQSGADAVFNAKKSRLQAEMEGELSNANLTEEQKLAIKKKYAKEQQAMDIKQAIINGLLAVGKTFANFGWPGGIIPAALAVVQTGIEIAAIKAQQFAKGGFTKRGSKYEPAGIVHAGEWVAPQEMVNDPVAGRVIRSLERSRPAFLGSGAMRTTGIADSGYYNGGYVTQQAPAPAPIALSSSEIDRIFKERIDRLEVSLNINKVNSAQKAIQVTTQSRGI